MSSEIQTKVDSILSNLAALEEAEANAHKAMRDCITAMIAGFEGITKILEGKE